MAAGVGKTYAMLLEAQRRENEGADVVIGYLESHRRKETDDLAVGIEQVPRAVIDYRGIRWKRWTSTRSWRAPRRRPG